MPRAHCNYDKGMLLTYKVLKKRTYIGEVTGAMHKLDPDKYPEIVAPEGEFSKLGGGDVQIINKEPEEDGDDND